VVKHLIDHLKLLSQCSKCQQSLIPPREPLITSPLPLHPWEKGTPDLFRLDRKSYLIVVDYFSYYPEVTSLHPLQSASRPYCQCFLDMDNGPWFVSKDMREFTSSYGFDLVTSSPLYPQSNSLAKKDIKTTIKMLLKHSMDLLSSNMALLSFHLTPIPWCQFRVADGTKAKNQCSYSQK